MATATPKGIYLETLGLPRGPAVPNHPQRPGFAKRWCQPEPTREAQAAQAAQAELPPFPTRSHQTGRGLPRTPRVCTLHSHDAKEVSMSMTALLARCCPEPPGTSPCKGTCLCCLFCCCALCWGGADAQRRGFHTSSLLI